jgi:hypothetical protein
MLAEPTLGAAVADGIPDDLRDGYEIHRAALSYGMDVSLYPRQVLLAGYRDSDVRLAFVHGIPQTSNLAAVTYAQDKRMRRELLARAGLPVPEGATFAIGRQRDGARRFARAIGYPVVVKPAVGENMREVFAGLWNERELDAAIDYFRTPEADRPGFTRAAYSLTLLLEPDEEDGRTVTPAGYQFLLERHVSGRPLRLLVIGDRVVSGVYLPGDSATAQDGTGGDVCDEVHPTVAALAVRAARAVPGLAAAAVDLVLADHRRAVRDQPLWIVDFSERPSLAAQASVSGHRSAELGDTLLSEHAADSEITLGPPRDEIRIGFRADGATDPAAVVTAITNAADELGLTNQVRVTDRVEGTASGTFEGPPAYIALIFELLTSGRLHGQRAMLIEEDHQ